MLTRPKARIGQPATATKYSPVKKAKPKATTVPVATSRGVSQPFCAARAGEAAQVRLTPLELRLLQLLVVSAGETVAIERLLVHIWGTRGAGERQLLKQLVHRLRQKIEPDPAAPSYIVTAAGEGYRFDPRPH